MTTSNIFCLENICSYIIHVCEQVKFAIRRLPLCFDTRIFYGNKCSKYYQQCNTGNLKKAKDKIVGVKNIGLVHSS